MWALLALCLPACSYGVPATDVVPDVGAGDVAALGADAARNPGLALLCPGAQEPTPAGLRAIDFQRQTTWANTDVVVLFCNPLLPVQPDRVEFFVALDDHFGVPPSDPVTGTWAENELGVRVAAGLVWAGGDLAREDHHVGGRLSLPRRDPAGADVLAPGAHALRLHLGGLGPARQAVELQWSGLAWGAVKGL